MNSEELTTAVHAAWSAVKEELKDENTLVQGDEYRRRRQALEDAWKAYLYSNYGTGLLPSVQNLLFRHAWDLSHSNGYYNVESTFEDLCLLQEAIQELTVGHYKADEYQKKFVDYSEDEKTAILAFLKDWRGLTAAG